MDMKTLPHFNDHIGHAKLEPLTAGRPSEPYVHAFLNELAAGRPRGSVRVLDLGCGRGEFVAWLVEQGWDAWGADVEARYVANGRQLLGDRLRVTDGRLPFDDEFFDVVLSFEVLEHVADLNDFARDLARVTRPEARGLHRFPAKWTPIETHMLIPVAHWLPKGRVRQCALRLVLAAHLDAGYFSEFTLDERVAIYAQYSDQETFYRRIPNIEATFRRSGFEADARTGKRAAQKLDHPTLPRPVLGAAAS